MIRNKTIIQAKFIPLFLLKMYLEILIFNLTLEL